MKEMFSILSINDLCRSKHLLGSYQKSTGRERAHRRKIHSVISAKIRTQEYCMCFYIIIFVVL